MVGVTVAVRRQWTRTQNDVVVLVDRVKVERLAVGLDAGRRWDAIALVQQIGAHMIVDDQIAEAIDKRVLLIGDRLFVVGNCVHRCLSGLWSRLFGRCLCVVHGGIVARCAACV